MMNWTSFELPLESLADDSRTTQTRVRIRIPHNYQHDPIISDLISAHHLTVNIRAAMLGANARGDGWFDLELRGSAQQIYQALFSLNELNLEIWKDSNTEEIGW